MAEFKWVDAGPAAMAMADHIMNALVQKGVLTIEEREQILDNAIADLESSDALKQAADNIRKVFQRP
jgi:hypothetical protein